MSIFADVSHYKLMIAHVFLDYRRREALFAVTLDDVERVAKQYFVGQKYGEAVLGDAVERQGLNDGWKVVEFSQ